MSGVSTGPRVFHVKHPRTPWTMFDRFVPWGNGIASDSPRFHSSVAFTVHTQDRRSGGTLPRLAAKADADHNVLLVRTQESALMYTLHDTPGPLPFVQRRRRSTATRCICTGILPSSVSDTGGCSHVHVVRHPRNSPRCHTQTTEHRHSLQLHRHPAPCLSRTETAKRSHVPVVRHFPEQRQYPLSLQLQNVPRETFARVRPALS